MNNVPYGSWHSPITADLIVASTIGLGQIAIDLDHIYWIETRPNEGGRNVIVSRSPDGQITDITPAPYNVRNRVHEYGGGAFLVVDGLVYFANFSDQRLYRQNIATNTIMPLTPAGKYRYADPIFDRQNQRLICVREDHTNPGEAVNTIVSINLENSADIEILVSGNDFYSSPRLSPDCSQLCWLEWSHPNLPWDGTELWIATINDGGSLGTKTLVVGGPSESIFQPEYSPDGLLYLISDRSNWWNIYQAHFPNTLENISEMAVEFGRPQWVFGMSNYAFVSADQIVCTYTSKGIWYLATIDLKTKKLTVIDTPYTDISAIKANGHQVYFLGSSPTLPSAIASLDLDTGKLVTIRSASQLEIDPKYLSIPQAIEFPTDHGLTAYALFYPPQNADYQTTDIKPPLLVKSHGGPTAATSSSLSLKTQYWTSRGFAILDVNYGGSTGYGREYRQRLVNQWGIVDVNDCINGAKYLVKQGLVDGEKMAISGGSAGGYTTLCALTFHNVFKAGASHYGIGDLIALATDTHKFEARYLDSLIGPYPEREDLYIARSPINFTDRLSCPVIFLQGLEDQVVPPNQAEKMVNSLKNKGLPVAYIAFPGEQHGFRQATNIKRSIEAEFYFYAQVFGFSLAEEIEPVEIDNLQQIINK